MTNLEPHLDLAGDHEAARQIGPWLREGLARVAASHLDRIGEIELAVHEMAINIVDHALAGAPDVDRYSISLRDCEGDLVVRFLDTGLPVDELPAAPDPDHPQVRGYGLMIIEQLASSVQYERVDGHNRWTLCFEA